jgi:hypothetical protein
MYADIRPSTARPLASGSTLGILDWDGDRVQYTQLNYNAHEGSNIPVPSSTIEDDSTNKGRIIELAMER